MSNLVYPALPGLKWSMFLQPEWSNTGKSTVSGRDFYVAHWSSARYTRRLQYEVLRAGAEAEFQNLIGFFNKHRGDFDTWLFDDPDDNTVVDQQVGTGNGTTTQFQLLRARGGFADPVYEPHSSGPGLPVIKVNSVVQSSGYTIGANGVLTFSSAPASGPITWSGQFYWRCRFTKSMLEFEQFLQDLWSLRQVEFKTWKP